MFVNHPHIRGRGRGRHVRGRGRGRHAPHPYAVSKLRGHMSKFACNGLEKKTIEASVSCNYV